MSEKSLQGMCWIVHSTLLFLIAVAVRCSERIGKRIGVDLHTLVAVGELTSHLSLSPFQIGQVFNRFSVYITLGITVVLCQRCLGNFKECNNGRPCIAPVLIINCNHYCMHS